MVKLVFESKSNKVNQRFFKSNSNDFLKLSSKISQLYIMLMAEWYDMSAFDKKFVLAFVIIFWEEIEFELILFFSE